MYVVCGAAGVGVVLGVGVFRAPKGCRGGGGSGADGRIRPRKPVGGGEVGGGDVGVDGGWDGSEKVEERGEDVPGVAERDACNAFCREGAVWGTESG